MKVLADTIYNTLLDMDYMDNEELKEQEVENLLHDLELLNKHGNGTLLKAIEILLEN